MSVVVAVFAPSCNRSGVITAPNIILDSETGIYTIKSGRELVIAPEYESAEEADFKWTLSGEVIGSSPSLHFMREEAGQYFITLTVTNEVGQDLEEIRVDVTDLEIPYVLISGSSSLMLAVGSTVNFTLSVAKTTLETSVGWSLNGTQVSTDTVYTFDAEESGDYQLIAAASNDDGSHSDTVSIAVLNPDDISFEWEFASTELHTVVGRKLLIAPRAMNLPEGAIYQWRVDGGAEVAGDQASFIYKGGTEGEHQVVATATFEDKGTTVTLTREFKVTLYLEESCFRGADGSSSAHWNNVYEYTPAPGQFINELKTGGFDGTQTTMEAAVQYAEKRLSATNKNGEPQPAFVSLGGFGGYIVVGFDHSIRNTGGYDLGVIGNAFDGSSEPAVVWVMQDENGNGLPDDTWYELAGSETGKEETIQNYSVTYFRPGAPGLPVQWEDNQGNTGEIDYLKQFHNQEYYYPLWVSEDRYTLTGTCLKARNYDKSGKGSMWINPHYDWGYADNCSPEDYVKSDKSNHFKISHAIDFDGQPVDLKFIDFVKVQVAVNAKSGWLGELSTEVLGFYDCNLKN